MSPSIVASVLFWLLVNTNLGDTLIDDRIKASDQLNFYTFEADQLVRVKRNVINGTSLANKTNSEIVFNESLVKFVNLNDSHEQLTGMFEDNLMIVANRLIFQCIGLA